MWFYYVLHGFTWFYVFFLHVFFDSHILQIVFRRMVHLNNDAVQKQGEESLGSTMAPMVPMALRGCGCFLGFSIRLLCMLMMLVFSSNIGEDGVAATGLTGHISSSEIGVDKVDEVVSENRQKLSAWYDQFPCCLHRSPLLLECPWIWAVAMGCCLV